MSAKPASASKRKGWYIGSTQTALPSRMRFVSAAMCVTIISGEGQRP